MHPPLHTHTHAHTHTHTHMHIHTCIYMCVCKSFCALFPHLKCTIQRDYHLRPCKPVPGGCCRLRGVTEVRKSKPSYLYSRLTSSSGGSIRNSPSRLNTVRYVSVTSPTSFWGHGIGVRIGVRACDSPAARETPGPPKP